MKKLLACAAAVLAAALGQKLARAGAENQSALSELVRMVSDQISRASPEGPVALYAGADSPELARNFTTLLASELANRRLGPIVVEASGPDAAESAARQNGARSLARISVALHGGVLEARGDLLGTWANFWSGAARTRPARPAAILQAAIAADAQVLAMLAVGAPPAQELNFQGATFAALALPPAALAAADLDGDGKDEILVLTDEELVVFSSEGRVLARRDHRLLSASPTPCREPFGALAALSSPPRVAYYSAARKRGEVLRFGSGRDSLEPVAALDEVPVATAGQLEAWGRFTEGQNTFAPRLRLNREQLASPAPFTTISLFQTAAASRSLIVFPDGSAVWSRDPLKLDGGIRLQDFGAGTALVDIDGDGEPELVTTSSQQFPAPDEIRVLSAPTDFQRQSRLKWRGPILRGRALQVTAARVQTGGGQEIVLGVWLSDGTGELQVFRRVPR